MADDFGQGPDQGDREGPRDHAPLASAEAARGLPGEALTGILWRRYGAWLAAGIGSDRILVLLDSVTRSAWTDLLKGEPPEHIVPQGRPSRRSAFPSLEMPTTTQRIHTPHAWIRQELTRWWPIVDRRLEAMGLPARAPVAAPRVVDVDMAQYLFERFSEDLRPPRGPLLEQARTPRAFQNTQLLDALGRALEHGASLAAAGEGHACDRLAREVVMRLRAGADPAAHGLIEEAHPVLRLYLEGMVGHRIFDFALALDLYISVLWTDPQYRDHLLSHVSHLLVEHLDEASPRLQDFYRELMEAGCTGCFTLQGDRPDQPQPYQGGLREAMGADPRGAEVLAARMVPIACESASPPFLPLGRALHAALNGQVRAASPMPGLRCRLDHLSFTDMVQEVVSEIRQRLGEVAPAEIALLVPALDPLVIWSLRHRLEQAGHALYVFAGTNRLTDYRPVRQLMTLSRLARPDHGGPPTEFELQEVLEPILELNPLRLGALMPELTPGGHLSPPERLRALEPALGPEAARRYERLLAWLERMAMAPTEDLALLLRQAFSQVFVPLIQRPAARLDERAQREISQVGQLIELAADFQAVAADLGSDSLAEAFSAFLGGNPIAERPFFKREPHQEAIMLSTASQLAQRGYRLPGERLRHLYVLDVGSDRWWKPDRRELTNPWVLSRHWPGGVFGPEDEQRHMDRKLARELFACCLKPTEGLHLHGCLSDAEGRESEGELPYLLTAILGPLGREARA